MLCCGVLAFVLFANEHKKYACLRACRGCECIGNGDKREGLYVPSNLATGGRLYKFGNGKKDRILCCSVSEKQSPETRSLAGVYQQGLFPPRDASHGAKSQPQSIKFWPDSL